MQPFLIPDDFRAFLQQAVATLADPEAFLDAEDALQDATGFGGRIEPGRDGTARFRFSYITRDGVHKWLVVVSEAELRDIADGLLIEVPADRFELVRTPHREPRGFPLLIWGEYGDDALHVRAEPDVLTALDALHAAAATAPRMLRMWSAADDQLVAVVLGDACALYVVESVDGYGTSRGDPTDDATIELLDHDGRPLVVPRSDCVPWERARNALLRFVVRGDLGPEIAVEGRIPTALLAYGDVDRDAVLAARAAPPDRLAGSSLSMAAQPEPEPEPVPDLPVASEPTAPSRDELATWANQLIEHLASRAWIELAPTANRDELAYQVANLLEAHGREAAESLDTATWLANELGALPGVSHQFASGGDLQAALARTR